MATQVDVLQAAEIPPERQGRARVSRLSDEERRLYLWILREFAAGVVPTPQALAATAAGFGIDLADALVVLAREDLVHTDAAGRPVVAYPFSAEPRGHQVRINRSHTVQAMCAIDALGIAPMLDLPIVIVSLDINATPGRPAT